MNILIVGNGFDLSHYLPTKYDHFMVAMGAIEGWDEDKGEMGFDDLFGSLYEKENYFFKYTKAMYQTDQIKVSIDQIKKIKQQLEKSVWYQYFSDHVKEIKTWIDFEKKIEEALNSICKFLNRIEDSFNEFGECNFPIYLLDKDQKKSMNEFYISLVDSKNFSILNLINKNLNFGNITDFWIDHKIGEIDKNWFYSSENYEYGISSEKYISYLNQQLEFFIIIFNFYLENIVMQLKSTIKLKVIADEFENLDRIYSFNYTDPYSNFYRFKKDIEFLHGRTGVDQNIVLGISDLNNDYLIKIKAYGFTKYHQKMYKNTDYIFLSEIINHFYYTERQVKSLGDEINSYLDNPSLSVDVYFRSMYDAKIRDYGLLKRSFEGVYNIKIWGHSLDQSDENYIKEIFSFNGEFIEQRCDVTIFYFNENAKFDLLSNLLAILGNKLIEKWMKKSWLKFKPNPNIVEINNIQPVDLIKFYEE